MSLNAWNLSQTKTAFFIRQRKQAQKKHLEKLKSMKSTIELTMLSPTSHLFHLIGSRSRAVDVSPQQHRKNSLSPTPIQDSLNSSIIRKAKSPNTSYVQNLRVSTSLSRLRQTKEIEKENEKLFSRLIKAKPSISDIEFRKDNINHRKYKENILRNKYLNPDYTKEAKTQTKSFSHLLLKPINNLNKLKQSKPYFSRIKEDIKSDNYRFSKQKPVHSSNKNLKL